MKSEMNTEKRTVHAVEGRDDIDYIIGEVGIALLEARGVSPNGVVTARLENIVKLLVNMKRRMGVHTP